MIWRFLVVCITIFVGCLAQDRYPYPNPNRFTFPSAYPYPGNYPNVPSYGGYSYGPRYPVYPQHPYYGPGVAQYPLAPTLYGTINVDRFGMPYVGVNPYYLSN